MKDRRGRKQVMSVSDIERARKMRKVGVSWALTSRILSMNMKKNISVNMLRYALDKKHRARCLAASRARRSR